MRTLQQVRAIVGMSFNAVGSRAAASIVIVISMFLMVLVALSIFSMSAGLTEMIRQTVPNADRMAILRQGGIDGGPSSLPREALAILADTPGLMKDPDGKPLISGTVSANYVTRKRANGIEAFVGVTGVAPSRVYGRPEIKIVAGRVFTPGLRELIAGKAATERFEGVALGNDVLLADGPWKIVGIFTGAGTSDFNLWGDSDTVMSAFKRNSYNVLFARLQEGTTAAQEAFKTAVKANQAVNAEAETELAYRLRGSKDSIDFYRLLAYGVGAIMSLGVVVATLNTMYAAVSARTVEIATLRALGFGAVAVAVSIVIECLSLALVGAGSGTLIAWIVFDGRAQNFGSIAINEAVTHEMIAAAIAAALVVGVVGSLFPAIRAARMPIVDALRAT